MWAVWGTGVTCENTVTCQDHLHLREEYGTENHSDY